MSANKIDNSCKNGLIGFIIHNVIHSNRSVIVTTQTIFTPQSWFEEEFFSSVKVRITARSTCTYALSTLPNATHILHQTFKAWNYLEHLGDKKRSTFQNSWQNWDDIIKTVCVRFITYILHGYTLHAVNVL